MADRVASLSGLELALLGTVGLCLAAIAGLALRLRVTASPRRHDVGTLDETCLEDSPLLDAIPDLVWQKDAAGRYLQCNARFAEFAGVDPPQVIGRSDRQLFGPEVAQEWRRLERATMDSGRSSETEEWVRAVTGRHSLLLAIKRSPLYDTAGRLTGILAIGRDISERHRVDSALRQKEAYQRALLDNFPFLVWLKDRQSRYLAANRAFADAAGFADTEELVGKDDHAVWPQDLARRYRADDRDVMVTRIARDIEEEIESGGTRTWVETYKAPVTDETGKLLGTVGFARDVSEQHRAIELLRQSEARFRRFFEGHSAVMLMIDPDSGSILDANRAALAFYGFQDGELVGRPLAAINAESFERAHARCIEIVEHGHRHYELEHRLADGTRCPVEVYATAIDQDGTTLIQAIVHDISQRSRALASLEEAQLALDGERQRLADILEATDVGTWEWNLQTGETRFNERWADIIGYTLAELGPTTIQTWLDNGHPDDLADSEASLARHLDGDTPFYEAEVRMRHKDGHWVWVLDRGRVITHSSDGRPLWIYGVHIDITERKASEMRLRASEQRMRAAARISRDVVYEWRNDTDPLVWFGDIGGMLGLSPAEVPTSLDGWMERVHPNDRTGVREVLVRARESGERLDISYRVRGADGAYLRLRDISAASDSGLPSTSPRIGVCRDMTAQHRDEEKLRLGAMVLDQSQQPILITDADARIVEVNHAFSETTGFTRDETIGRTPAFLASGQHDEAFFSSMWRALAETGHWRGEIWNRHRNGSVFTETVSISAVRDAAGDVTHYVAMYTDISSLKEQQEKLERAAYIDALTQLPNRALLTDRLRQAMPRAQRHGHPLAIACLDLDCFKEINDRFGHAVGDRLLLDLATRLRQTLREEDTLARIGGDEFAVILSDLADQEACTEVLRRLLQVARQSIDVDGHTFALTASIGATLYPQPDDVDPDQLLRQADHAMYQAKTSGKDRYYLFDHSRDRRVRGQVEIVDGIRAAIGASELALYFQPKVNMRTGEILGAEALVRWPLPHGGIRMPAEFLPFIDDGPVICELDDWVIRSALAQLDAWRQEGRQLTLSVNISAMHLQQSDFVGCLRDHLEAFPQVDPGRLVIEILETTALMDLSRISAVIRAGHQLGVSFALDDFGTGYSSLTYLKNLPASQIKIDRSFVRDMLDDRDDLSILEGIMGLAKAFDRVPVAEGVESIEHGELLLMLGCELAQGFGIGRPMPSGEFADWCDAWRPDPVWRECRTLGRDDLQLAFAIVEHRAWIKALKSQTNGNRLPLPSLDPHDCKLGRWLDERGSRSIDPSRLGIMLATHAEIHELAPRIVYRGRDEDTPQLEQRLDRLQRGSDRLVRDLWRQLRLSGNDVVRPIGVSGAPATGKRQPG